MKKFLAVVDGTEENRNRFEGGYMPHFIEALYEIFLIIEKNH